MTQLTQSDLIKRAFDRDFKITREQAIQICNLYNPSEFSIQWHHNSVLVHSLNVEFTWGKVEESTYRRNCLGKERIKTTNGSPFCVACYSYHGQEY